MAEAVLTIRGLSGNPLEAAAYFYAEVLPGIRRDYAYLPEINLIIVFDPAGHEHRAWRLAVVQELAREYAPSRVNALASGDEAAIAAAERYLGAAQGVTGQLLVLDSIGAGEVLSLSR
jgi:hypothetical protein